MQADDSSFFEFMLAIRLIDDPLVYEELRISKTQREELAEKIRAIKKTHLDWKGALRRQGVPAYEENVKKANVLVAEGETVVREVLLGFQYDRLLQIARQKEATMSLPTSGLIEPEFADAIGLKSADKKKIKGP